MRAVLTVMFAGAALASLAGCSKPASAPASVAASGASAPAFGSAPIALKDLPRRKPGLWRQTASLAGSSQVLPPIQACTDAVSESKLTLLGQHKSEDLCQNQAFSRNTDGSISFSVSCDQGQRGKAVSTGRISGDFNSRYQIEMDSKTTGAPIPAANTERRMTITAVWTGPCAPGQRGGDMIMPDGRRMNLTDPAPRPRYP